MFNAQVPGRAPLDGARMLHRLRERELIEAAAQESSEIVLRTAGRIAQITDAAACELAALEAQVAATIGAGAPESATSSSGPGSGSARPTPHLSPEALGSLQAARRSLETLLQQVEAPGKTHPSVLQVHPRAVLSAASGIILVAAGFGIATGWLSAAHTSFARSESRESIVATAGKGAGERAAPPDSPSSGSKTVAGGRHERLGAPPAATTADSDSRGATPPPSAAPPDDLRGAADAWLRTYFETGTAPASTPGAAIRDERQPGERVSARAARRVIAPARIDVFGDAAVLTTSVTEHPEATPDREVTSLVAQLWTRTGGQWQLDDVRIVSAAGAEHAFHR